MTKEYHRQELLIALDPQHPAHLLPPKPRPDAKVLDVGCGAGQTLLAWADANRAFGVDPDWNALRTSKSLGNSTRLVCGRSEQLPYRSGSFDFVVARVSLPYTDIVPALREIRRVLKTGGSVWLMLHSFHLRMSWLRDSSWQEKVFGAYVLINSLLFHAFQKQFSFLGRQETFQTNRGMRRALLKCGFRSIVMSREQYFVVIATA